jgi:hypothetical protein
LSATIDPRTRLVATLLVALLQACSSVPVRVDSTPSVAAAGAPVETPGVPTSVASSPILMPATAFAESVSISAVDGNLFIRRGPHLAFNTVGVLYEGQRARAVGRDMLLQWAQVELPGSGDKMGWVSVQTRFSDVLGRLDQLPVIDTTDWPEAAYIRNCTHHEMQVHPGERQLPSAWQFPNNEVQVFPGVYAVTDTEVSGEPEVLTVSVGEGDLIEVREDASGERRKCPTE